jgi:hypothetical protein
LSFARCQNRQAKERRMRNNYRSCRLQNIPRVILGSILLLGMLATTFPMATIASSPMCTLSCCVGRAPHAAGSCMNGTCHAYLRSRANTTRIQRAETYTEKFCGLNRLTQFNRSLFSSATRSVARIGDSPTQQSKSNQRSISGGAMTKPCDPDCGGAVLGSSTQGRARHFSAIAYADKPKPPSTSRRYRYALSRSKILGGFGQRVSPRGPPLNS